MLRAMSSPSPLARLRTPLLRACGVRLSSDLYERAARIGLTLPLDAKRRDRIARIRAAGALFVHIPKNGGMSVSAALYGCQVKHVTVRYYATVAPDLLATLPSFATLRDPAERFVSAFHYARAGGSRDNRVSLPFRALYADFIDYDDALDHLEGLRSPFQADHIFRPQSWYVTRPDGSVAVDRLLLLDRPDAIAAHLRRLSVAVLPHLNRGPVAAPPLSPRQQARVARLYARDVALVDGVRHGRCVLRLPATGTRLPSLAAAMAGR